MVVCLYLTNTGICSESNANTPNFSEAYPRVRNLSIISMKEAESNHNRLVQKGMSTYQPCRARHCVVPVLTTETPLSESMGNLIGAGRIGAEESAATD